MTAFTANWLPPRLRRYARLAHHLASAPTLEQQHRLLHFARDRLTDHTGVQPLLDALGEARLLDALPDTPSLHQRLPRPSPRDCTPPSPHIRAVLADTTKATHDHTDLHAIADAASPYATSRPPLTLRWRTIYSSHGTPVLKLVGGSPEHDKRVFDLLLHHPQLLDALDASGSLATPSSPTNPLVTDTTENFL